MSEIQANERTEVSKRVTLVGALINTLLSVLKVVFGFVAQSNALIVDGIHSLSDLLSDAWYGLLPTTPNTVRMKNTPMVMVALRL